MSTGNTAKHIQLMHDCGSTALACTPSYALYLAEQIIKSGIPRSEFRLRTCILGGEPWTENMRREIEAKLGVDAYNIYGLSEIMGPGVSYECRCKSGSHIVEDHFYPEIIDSNTLEPQPAGGQGRAGAHDPDQRGYAAVALPHQRPLFADLRTLRLRTH